MKTTITTQDSSYILDIPANYIGKKVEILLYSLDQIAEEKHSPKKSMIDFSGILSENDKKLKIF